MPFADPRIHSVTMLTAEVTVDPPCVTISFEQPDDFGPLTAQCEIYLSKDQDAYHAYMLAAAINCSILDVDDLEDRRRRAAMALGWVYMDETDTDPGHWERPWREGDESSDNPQRADIVEEALQRDLDMADVVGRI